MKIKNDLRGGCIFVEKFVLSNQRRACEEIMRALCCLFPSMLPNSHTLIKNFPRDAFQKLCRGGGKLYSREHQSRLEPSRQQSRNQNDADT
mmetsp:Transcript_4839/g.6274  ORF Transcript_4839/g.6274 Transcript_4839/m.6274 type:complete len:91 (-) Transcript_4839:103-375(-)